MSGAIEIRFAREEDCALLLRLIRELATYERAPDAVVATEADLRRHGFGPERRFEAILAFLDGEPAGAALFHSRFSTWLGRPGLYLEDLYVTEAARGHGVGRRLMTRLAAIAVERGWGRIDFHVLDWNPARGFYHRLGMEHVGDWLRYGGDEHALRRLAGADPGRELIANIHIPDNSGLRPSEGFSAITGMPPESVMFRIEPVAGILPAGFNELRAEAHAEGYRHLERLAVDWAAGALRFDGEAEALLAARSGAVLAGIGGLTRDPGDPVALRLRRFYVAKSCRRHGVGRALAVRLLARAAASGGPVTVNAAAGSEMFWQALGFHPDPRDGHTHVLRHHSQHAALRGTVIIAR